MEERETVGKLSSELLQKEPDSLDPIEIQRELHKDYEDNISFCVNRHKREIIGDFYVVVITKKERLMENVLRNYFTARASCPTPDYDQTVYRYNKSDDFLEFMWTIPDKGTCHLLRDNAINVAPEERDLRDFVIEFLDGSLLKLSKKLNREVADSNILQKSDKIIIASS
jgi:hypothetical protein